MTQDALISTHLVTLTWSDMRPRSCPANFSDWKIILGKLDAQNDAIDEEKKCSLFAWIKWIDRWNRSTITLIYYFVSNDHWVTGRNVMPAGPESGAGAVGRGRSVRHVPGVCGASTLHAHQRHRLLERMEWLCVLHTSEQQRYSRTLISLFFTVKNTNLLRQWQRWETQLDVN